MIALTIILSVFLGIAAKADKVMKSVALGGLLIAGFTAMFKFRGQTEALYIFYALSGVFVIVVIAYTIANKKGWFTS